MRCIFIFFFFQAEDGIRDADVTGVQTCALPILSPSPAKVRWQSMNQGRIGLEMVSWTAIGLLLATGIVNLLIRTQATAAAPSGAYAIILGAKLFLFGAMVVHPSLQVFKYAPRIAALTAELPPNTTAWPDPLLSH